jgi:threonylcarbamoyladenosine tRNA methylthiotransferase CDKAL1
MKKFYLETYGCKLNQSDSDLIRGVLARDFKEVSSSEEADFVVINSCGVVGKTEMKILKRAKSLKGKKIIMAGCLPLISPKGVVKVANGVIGPKDILCVAKVAEQIVKDKKVFQVSNKLVNKAKYYQLKKRRDNGISAIVPIAEGCLGNCSFCATRHARGKLKSFAMNDILREIKYLINSGYKEINLTSQDSVLYGLDRGKFLLPVLLNKISSIKGDFRVRVGMMNPFFAKKISKELISSFASEKIYNFLHLPLQSGDDKILKEMNRNYRISDFVDIVNDFRRGFNDVLLATDIIVGYPGETEINFNRTIKVIKKTKPSIVHIFRFSKRPFSQTINLKDYPDRIKKERSRELTKLSQKINIKDNRNFLGKEFEVLISEKGKKGTLIGRTPSFRAVILKQGKLGSFEKVKIIDFENNYLVGKIIY